MNFIKFLLTLFFTIWTLPQNLIGFIYRLLGSYKKTSRYKSRSFSNKYYNIGNKRIFWKNVYNFKKKSHRKTNMWVLGNYLFFKISLSRSCVNYNPPESELIFADCYRTLSDILGPLYILFILIPAIWHNWFYDTIYSKINRNKPIKLNRYWSKWWLSRLVNKMYENKTKKNK